jgi:cytidylate kinase
MKFITFSRQLGTGGHEIAQQVADKLGYKFHDTESIGHAAREMGFLDSVEQIDEKRPSFFQRFFSHKPTINLDRLNSVIYQLANQGDGVFLGRGGQILLKSFSCALHVRVIASREKRIQNLIKRGYTEETASKAIEESDQERAAFIKFAFGLDWEAPDLYDIVLNIDKLSVNLAIDTVVAIASSDEINACSLDSMETLSKLALVSRTEAAIVESGLSYGQSTAVSVSVEVPGKVTLTGVVENEKGRIRAEGVVRGVKGVEAVDNQIRVRPGDRHA